MTISRIMKDDFDTKKKSREILAEYKEYVGKGKWKIKWLNEKVYLIRQHSDGKIFFRKKTKEIRNEIGGRTLKKQFIRNIMSYSWMWLTFSRGNIADSDLILISQNEFIYFFDNRNDVIIKMYGSDNIEKNFLLLEEHRYWDFFNSPVIEHGSGIHKERIVESKGKQNKKDILGYLLETYGKYMATEKPVQRVRLEDILDDLDMGIFNDFLSDEVRNYPINYYYMHGDLNIWNVIPSAEKQCYLVDYEYVGVYPFFYDIITFCLNFRGKISIRTELLRDENIATLLKKIFLLQGWSINERIFKVICCITASIYVRYINSHLKRELSHGEELRKTEIERLKDFISDIYNEQSEK